MWQRAVIVMVLLSAVVFLLISSSNSRVDEAANADREFSSIVVDSVPTEAENEQMSKLRAEATSAMQALRATNSPSEHRLKIQARLPER